MKGKIIRLLVLAFVSITWAGCMAGNAPEPAASELEQVQDQCAPVFEWLGMCESEAK